MNGCGPRAAACSSITSAMVRVDSGRSRASGSPYFAKRQSCPSRSKAMRGSLARAAGRSARPGRHADPAALRLAVLPEQDALVADQAHQLGPGARRQLLQELAFLVLPVAEAHLDQLVREELRLGLRDHCIGQAFLSDHHHGLEPVCESAQVAALESLELVHGAPERIMRAER